MPICVKCNHSIKPASLETKVAGESYHPTCIQCATCDKPLWGKPFKRTKTGNLVCEQPCNPRMRTFTRDEPAPTSQPITPARPPSANKIHQPPEQKQISVAIEQQLEYQKQIQFQNNGSQVSPYPPPESYRKPIQDQQFSSPPPQYNGQYGQVIPSNYNNGPLQQSQYPGNYMQSNMNSGIVQPQTITNFNQYQNKICKVCGEAVWGSKRYITFENGEIICQECDNRVNARPARVNSAHMIVCSVCDRMVRGSKFYTEPSGKIICDNCENTGLRCTKCNSLFTSNENRRILPNMPNVAFHDYCFSCVNCQRTINSNEQFFQNENGSPMCLSCFEISKLPKCSVCQKHLSGPYILIENQPMHKECFKCSSCFTQIVPEKGFFKNKLNNQPLCGDCNIKLNGSKCGKCNLVIEKDGVSFSFKDYHRECFNCDKCGTNLTHMKRTLTDKENRSIYCEPCFNNNFLPRCSKCNNPILPQLPGTTYEEKTFHKECFTCGRCKRTLADRKFFKAGSILICESCY